MIPIENLITVGAKCHWFGNGVKNFPKKERKKILHTIFTIVDIDGKTDPMTDFNCQIHIINKEQGVEGFVTPNEIFIVE